MLGSLLQAAAVSVWVHVVIVYMRVQQMVAVLLLLQASAQVNEVA